MENDPRFSAICDADPIGFALIERETGLLGKVNERFCDLVGINKDTAESITFKEIAHPEDLKEKLYHVHALLEGGLEVLVIEKNLIREDGSKILCNFTLCPLRDIYEGCDYYLALVEDVTERKKRERRLQEKNDFLEQRVEQLEKELEIKTKELESAAI